MQEAILRRQKIHELMLKVYGCFSTGDFFRAESLLSEIHDVDFGSEEVRLAMKACKFWQNRLEHIGVLGDDFSRGNYLCLHWRKFEERFQDFCERLLEEDSVPLKFWVYNEALNYYEAHAEKFNDVDSVLQSGRCLKYLGEYDDARRCFEDVLQNPVANKAQCMAELADVHMLIGEIRYAKVMMKEALFLDASRVELSYLVATEFRKLISSLERRYSMDSPVFNEWLAVYGVLWTVLNESRELNELEYRKLQQSIYALKVEIAEGDTTGILTPRLLNHYFRLIDYYQFIGASHSKIEEVLMDIQYLSPGIYKDFLR